MNYLLKLAYDGTDYCGFQVQPNGRSVAQTFQDALKQYAKRKDKDLRKLMRYAQMFRVEKLLRQYLEVLL